MSASPSESTPTSNRPWLNAYGPGVPGRLDYPDITVGDLLTRAADDVPDQVALDFLGARTTYRRLADEVSRVAAGLAELGVGPGDRVALLLPNCPQHLIAFYATLRLGAVVVEHNPLYTEAELDVPFTDHGATVAIVWDKIAPVVQGLSSHGAALQHVVAVDLTAALPLRQRLLLRLPVPRARRTRREMTAAAPGTIPWSSLRTHGRAEAYRADPGETALILYTSGTTGVPKGVPLTHRNLVANCVQGEAWVPGLVRGGERYLSALPMFHAYGITMCVLFGVHMAATLVLLPKPDIDLVMKAFARQTPTFVPAVPPLYARIVETAEERGVSIRGVRNSFSGAMPLPPELVRRWEEATGGLLVEGYGLTECSPILVGNPMTSDRRPGSIGVPFPDVEIRVVDIEDPTRDVAQGESGELLVRGPQVFAGYRNAPEATADAFSDGWFRTGDVVEMAADGFLTVVDRTKELIITGGFNVYPSEVEEVLRGHQSVADCAVVGIKGAGGSERVGAVVVLEEGARLEPEALRAHARRSLTAYKVPHDYLAVDELPTNAMGKVLRGEAAKVFS